MAWTICKKTGFGRRGGKKSRGGLVIFEGEKNDRKIVNMETEYGAFSVTCRRRYEEEQPAVLLVGYTAKEEEKELGRTGLEKMFDLRLSEGPVFP